MALNYERIQIDPELEQLLPPLSKEDYNILEQSLISNGFQEKFGRIRIWCPDKDDASFKSKMYIVDGHNRYKICKKNNIDLPHWCYDFIFFDSKEEVIKWMYENQLARRNLSEVIKYEIVEKYNRFLSTMAKKNQSDGGKGLSNLTKVNARKEKAKQVGISEGSYHKLDKVMKSGNESVIDRVRNKEISIDKAYQAIKNPAPNKEESTIEHKLEKFDNRMNEIDKEISTLRTERESLMRRRSSLFEAFDIKCDLQYEFIEKDSFGLSRTCRFFIELNGHKEIFVESSVYNDDTPWSLYINKVPEKYKNDFIMLWKKAHIEDIEDFYKRTATWGEKYEKSKNASTLIPDCNKDFYKKCFRILAKNFHPDNEDGNMEDMQFLNELKATWGI